MLVKNEGFATSLRSTMFQICGDVEAAGFPYKTLTKWRIVMRIQPLNPGTFEPVNGYKYINKFFHYRYLNREVKKWPLKYQR